MNKYLIYFCGIFMLLRCGYCDRQCIVGTVDAQSNQLKELACSVDQKLDKKLQFIGDKITRATDFCAIFATSASPKSKLWKFSCDDDKLCSSEFAANITGTTYIKQNVILNGTLGDLYCCYGKGCNGLMPASEFLSANYTQCPASSAGITDACLTTDNCVSVNAVTYEGALAYKCDTSRLCAKYNISSGQCKKVSVVSQSELLNICCCSGLGCVAKFKVARIDQTSRKEVSIQATTITTNSGVDSKITVQSVSRSASIKSAVTMTPKARNIKFFSTTRQLGVTASSTRNLLYNSETAIVGQVRGEGMTGVRQQAPLVSWWVVYGLVATLCVGGVLLVALFSLVICRKLRARGDRPVIYAYSQLTAEFNQNGRDNEDDFLLIG